MYIQVRTIDGKQRASISISKTRKIIDLKGQVSEELNVPVEKQRLFFRGKQLEDDYTLFDYDINLNDVIQLMIKVDAPTLAEQNKVASTSTTIENGIEKKAEEKVEEGKVEETAATDQYYKVGDIVDCKSYSGAWFECEIKEILPNKSAEGDEKADQTKSSLYKVKFSDGEEEEATLELENVRPRARNVIKVQDLKNEDTVVVNYNLEETNEPGFWYTSQVEKIVMKRVPEIRVKLFLGRNEKSELIDCKIKFTSNILKLEEPKLITDRTAEDEAIMRGEDIPQRNVAGYTCKHCKDSPFGKCKFCGCEVCGEKDEPGKQLLCDECNNAYHIWCLKPPLQQVPDIDDWYCPECKNDENEIVKAGENLKFSKKKSKMASKDNSKDGKVRDWGKGMACVGRTKVCTIVQPNHFGPIPGVEVGTCWKFRLQVSEAGVHRPHVAGIHGREDEGAYSIVLSGGYEDDIDNGDNFYYTGSGGRDLSGNKRTAEQSCDQALTRMNLALASNCKASVDAVKGATAKDWKMGKPVRVVRNYKLHKRSKYAPEEGNRYDGIYKVVKYYPEKGKSGFLVWRYFLRRDDPTPAPWTKEGKEWIQSQGLEKMLEPEGYEEIKKNNNQVRGKKRILEESFETPQSPGLPKKKTKIVAYKLSDKIRKLIDNDVDNSKLWETVLTYLIKGKLEFLAEVQKIFMCICCQDLVNNPVTTECKHNVCKACLCRSFKAEVYSCASCRFQLGENYKINVNENLKAALHDLFPGYSNGRV